MASSSPTERLFKAYLLDQGRIFRAPVRRIESVAHAHLAVGHALILVLTGSYSTRWEEGGQTRRLQAGPGEVVYWPARMARIEANDPPSPPLTIAAFDFSWSNPPPGLPHKVSDRMAAIRTLADLTLSAQGFSGPHRQLILNGYLSAMLAEYCRLAQGEGEGVAGRVARYVYDHIEDHIGVDDLAHYVGMGRRQLQREFKALAEETLMQAVRRIRIEQAAWMVRQTPRPLKDIAARVGICHEHALSKLLKKHTGLTAGQLRAGRRKSKIIS